VVSKIISKQMSVSEAAAAYGVSRQYVHRWLARYRDDGFDGLEPRSWRPHSNPRRTAAEVAERILALRRELAGQGLDHGPQTIGWHLEQEHLPVPSTSTIRRILVAAGLVTPEPRKRPKSSYRRFEADQPNQCWQSDFTHWQLADGTGVEIINWLDDHSRYLLAAIARPRQVDHQTEQGGSVSGTGFAGDASPSRRQRRHGDLLPQPDPSGLDSPITGRWSPNAPSSPSTATCGG
jgi:transposase InsO family protein